MERPGRFAMLQQMLEKEPKDLFLNYALALELAADPAKARQAEEQFAKVLQLDPEYVPAYYQLGKLRENNGQNNEALEIFRKGLSLAREKKDLKSANEFDEAIFLLED